MLRVTLVIGFLCLLAGCSRAHDDVISKSGTITRINSVRILESEEIPVLTDYHGEIVDSLLYLSDIAGGVIHVINIGTGHVVQTIHYGYEIVDLLHDQISAFFPKYEIMSSEEASDFTGLSVEELGQDRNYGAMMSTARISPDKKSIIVTGQFRVLYWDIAKSGNRIIPFMIKYNLDDLALIQAKAINGDLSEYGRLIDVSAVTVTEKGVYFRELDKSVLYLKERNSAPIYTLYTTEGVRVGGDIVAPRPIVGSYGYALQMNQAVEFDSNTYLYTSAVTPHCLVFNGSGTVQRTISYEWLLHTLIPNIDHIPIIDPRGNEEISNPYLCTGFVPRSNLAAAVLVDWTAGRSREKGAQHIAVVQFDALSSSYLPRAVSLSKANIYQPSRVLAWGKEKNTFIVLERDRSSRDWMVSTYLYSE